MRHLNDCRLYGILDLSYVKAAVVSQVAEAMIEGAVDLIQIRGKAKSIGELSDIASTLHPITERAFTPLIVNDFAEVAAKLPIEGVHVGQDDDPISRVREKAARNLWVGKSTHSVVQAVQAQREGADYIGFGPIFATPTKPDYKPIGLDEIARVHEEVMIPIFCIGGITLANLVQVIAAGAQRVVIVSALLKAQDIRKYARAAKQMLAAKSEIR